MRNVAYQSISVCVSNTFWQFKRIYSVCVLSWYIEGVENALCYVRIYSLVLQFRLDISPVYLVAVIHYKIVWCRWNHSVIWEYTKQLKIYPMPLRTGDPCSFLILVEVIDCFPIGDFHIMHWDLDTNLFQQALTCYCSCSFCVSGETTLLIKGKY